MASWYDDLLKRQEYQYRQGQPTYKPNAFQEMFTPEGMEYQWQAPLDEGGGEYTGYTPGGYEGDTQTLRMVKPPSLSVATPTVPDGTQASPVVTPSAPLPVGFDGERSNSTLHGFLTATRPSPLRGKVPTPRMTMPALEAGLDAAKAKAVRGGWIPPEADPAVVRGTTRPTVDTTRPVRPGPRVGGAASARRSSRVPFGRGRHSRIPLPVVDAAIPPEPMDRTRGRWSRWNRWGGHKPAGVGGAVPTSARVAPGSGDGMPLESRTTPRGTPSGVGGAGNFFREGWLRRNIPEHVRNLGHTKTAAFLRGLNPAAWALTGLDLGTAAWGDPTGFTERQGLAAQKYSGNELIDINAQRAMQGLPPLQGQGAGEEGMQDFTEYFIDSRNYDDATWENPASYWWDKMPWNNPSPITPPRTRTRYRRWG